MATTSNKKRVLVIQPLHPAGMEMLRARDDIEIIEAELMLADIQTLENALNKAERTARSGDKEAKATVDVVQKCLAHLGEDKPLRSLGLYESELQFIHSYGLLTLKPVLYVANVAEDDLNGEGELVQKVRDYAAEVNAGVVHVCARLEAEIAELDEEIFSRTITMNGVSKAYSMTGWRIGYCGGPIEIINSMRKLMGQSTSNPSSISQWATVEALNGSKEFLDEWINSFKERRDFIVNYLNNCKGIECLNPEGAFYVYPSCSGLIGKEYQGKIIENDKDFAMILLKEKLVSVVHGEAFGLSPFFRISYATSMDNIKEACDRIGEFCDEATS